MCTFPLYTAVCFLQTLAAASTHLLLQYHLIAASSGPWEPTSMVRSANTRLLPSLADLHCAIPAASKSTRSQTPLTCNSRLLPRFHLLCACSGPREPASILRSPNGSRLPPLADGRTSAELSAPWMRRRRTLRGCLCCSHGTSSMLQTHPSSLSPWSDHSPALI